MANIESGQRIETGTNSLVAGVRELGQELLKRLPLGDKDNKFSPAVVLDRFGRFAECVREQVSLEEPAELFVLLGNTLKKEVFQVQLHLKTKGDKFKRIILGLELSGGETKFTVYENNSYVAVPPKERQEETAPPPILQAFLEFLKEALKANPVKATS